MPEILDSLLEQLIGQLDYENTLGLILVGSFARGEGGPHSDIDLWQFLRQEALEGADPPPFEYIEGHLVTVKTTTLEKEYSSLENPKKAIWTIPALRQSRILFDKDNSIAALKDAADKASWEALQKAANEFASSTLAETCEEVQKILDGLARSDESKTAYAIWGLTQNLADALLVRRGILIPTENVFIDRVQATAGRTSEWTRQFRLGIGLDPLPPGTPSYVGFGIAGLKLYRETASLLRDILEPEDAHIVDRTLTIMTEAGY
jgi:hypothetical protein